MPFRRPIPPQVPITCIPSPIPSIQSPIPVWLNCRYGIGFCKLGGSGRGALLGPLLFHIGVDDGLAPRKLLNVQLRLLFWIGATESLPRLLSFLEYFGGLIMGLGWVGSDWIGKRDRRGREGTGWDKTRWNETRQDRQSRERCGGASQALFSRETVEV